MTQMDSGEIIIDIKLTGFSDEIREYMSVYIEISKKSIKEHLLDVLKEYSK